CARGMSMVTLHNGGGTGIGNAINGGFGLVLDGSQSVDDTIRCAISWDVMGGVARRNWARNTNAMEVCRSFNQSNQGVGHVTIPFVAKEELVKKLVAEKIQK
ncbi:MAG: urocanate hydratase, partial [Deltaproteobacteria bacterium]|nr:urocanate hydratase [Deltaproteobacteria bacterium]